MLAVDTVYHVEEIKPVGKISAKQFIASKTTKYELTGYLAHKTLSHYKGSSKIFLVLDWKGQALK